MNATALAAAHELMACRRLAVPLPRLAESCRPADIESALAIQRALIELDGRPPEGWKCGLPAEGRLVAAPILAGTVGRDARYALPRKNARVRIEPEVAFLLGHDLPPRQDPYSREEVERAVASSRFALEIVGGRYASAQDLPFAELLADQLFNDGLVIGPPIDIEQARRTAELAWEADGNVVRRAARHPDGNPWSPLYWLVEFLRRRGEGLAAGQAVITGSWAGVLDVPADTRLRIGMGGGMPLDIQFDTPAD
ncbi:fumarylacetoacetate hydrolase family protein [Paludibacterium paludis]|uniref:Hydratase n=1 Tax=Paludibacterium paludis TaxID=1225769 RepID=A0A918P671_9NEIS|nr:fumarylacetoacetate hydrolase family protein [Paludibacterium paludis]GGY24881.1 hydratase [Paludibacterium paludis]